MEKSLYQIFAKKLNLSEVEYHKLIFSYIVKNSKKMSDLPVKLNQEDFITIRQEVFIDLLSRKSEAEKFKAEEQIKAYINMVVKNKVTTYLTGILSPIKMNNPRGGAKDKTAALTLASHFRKSSFELDGEIPPDTIDELKVSEENFCPDVTLHEYNFNENPLLKKAICKGMERARKRGLGDLIRVDGNNENPVKGDVLASSHYNKIITEKINPFEVPGKFKVSGELCKNFFKEVFVLFKEKGVVSTTSG